MPIYHRRVRRAISLITQHTITSSGFISVPALDWLWSEKEKFLRMKFRITQVSSKVVVPLQFPVTCSACIKVRSRIRVCWHHFDDKHSPSPATRGGFWTHPVQNHGPKKIHSPFMIIVCPTSETFCWGLAAPILFTRVTCNSGPCTSCESFAAAFIISNNVRPIWHPLLAIRHVSVFALQKDVKSATTAFAFFPALCVVWWYITSAVAKCRRIRYKFLFM
jgi:hypothetical protein